MLRFLLLVLTLLTPALAQAHPPRAGNPAYVHACVNAAGAVRLVGAAKAVTCAAGETAEHWVRSLPAASPEPPANVVIAESRESFVCEGDTTGWQDIPGHEIEIETHGRPVAVAYRMPVSVLQQPTQLFSALFVGLVIDGVLDNENAVGAVYAPPVNTLTQRGEVLTFSRVLDLPAGLHTFKMQGECNNVRMFVSSFLRWLTVHEIR